MKVFDGLPRIVAFSLAAALMATGAWGAPTSHAAVTLGETFTPEDDFGGAGTLIQPTSPGSSYAAPFDGVITEWSYQPAASDTPPPLKLKVVRPAGGNSFTTVGDSALRTPTPDTLNTFATRLPVQAGDVIGYGFTDTTFSFRRDQAGYAAAEIGSDPPPGTTAEGSFVLGIQIDVSARLEADCDSDGFGDESQDPDTSSCNPPPEDGLPSNEFSLKIKKNKRDKRKGTATAKVTVPGLGKLVLAKNKKVKGKQKSAEEAGMVKMPIKPTSKAKRKLNERGKTKVNVEITYTPDGGEPNTKSRLPRLKKKARKIICHRGHCHPL